MDTPDRPPAGPAAGAAARFEDSPVFNFINNLSPIQPPKHLDSAHNVQLFKSFDFAPVSSIFMSPHVNPQKESKLLIKDASVRLSQEGDSPNSIRTRKGTSSSIRFSKCTAVASVNCSTTCSLNEASIEASHKTSIFPSKLPQSIQLDGGSLDSNENQRIDGKADLTTDHKHTNSGPDKTGSSNSRRNVQESQLFGQNKDEPAACDWDYLITHEESSVLPRLAPSFEAEAPLENETLVVDTVNSCKSLSTNAANLENSGKELFHRTTCSSIHSAADDPHVYLAGAIEGVATDYTSQVLPSACQSQFVSNDQISDKLNVPRDRMPKNHNAKSQHLRGMRRRSLFNEKGGASNMGVHSGSDLHSSGSTTPRCKGISGDNNMNPVRTPPCALPGIGLHLNALALTSKDNLVPCDTQSTLNQPSSMPCNIGSPPPPSEHSILNDDASQATMPTNANESGLDSPKKKRHKFENGDGASCKRCSCKKSKCLKLYCECFAAGVFCSEPCLCQGCLNKPVHMETVLSIREQIESRNPLAFAPKVIRTSEPGQELGEDSNKTPASARHKRGCNCKKSSCLKKYCECYQGGVGCSMSCRCEGCKNAFGRRDGVAPLATEVTEHQDDEKKACKKDEKNENDKHLAVDQTDYLPSTENLLTTPSIEPGRSLVSLRPPCSKPPRSSTKKPIGYSSQLCNAQAPPKFDIVLSPFKSYAEMILGDDTSDIPKGDSSPCTSVKVMSPNKKRVSPARIGAGLSPICKNGRKLILKSIPSFPSLTGDGNDEHPANSSSVH